MQDERIVRYSPDEIRKMIADGEDRTDWARVDALTDEDIERPMRDDPDWADLIDIDWSKAELVIPSPKRPGRSRARGSVGFSNPAQKSARLNRRSSRRNPAPRAQIAAHLRRQCQLQTLFFCNLKNVLQRNSLILRTGTCRQGNFALRRDMSGQPRQTGSSGMLPV
jgi:hypothetical protein